MQEINCMVRDDLSSKKMENTQDSIAIILAGGTGTRMGASLPKQYIEVEGRPIIYYTLRPFVNSGLFKVVVICADPHWHSYILENLPQGFENIKIEFSNPGMTRQFTIYNALNNIEKNNLICSDVLIHDAARPLVSENLLRNCLLALKDADGVLPVIKVKDTIYQSFDGQHVSSLLDRNTLYAGQSPESFKFTPYLEAHRNSSEEELLKINGSSELALLKGLKVDMIPGEENNFKITSPEDLQRFKQILRQGDDC